MKTRKPVFLIVLVSLFVMFASASAQTPSATVSGAITVSGEASASAPAEQALVVITLGVDGGKYYDPMTGMPNADATATAIDSTAVVDAIVAFGIPADAIEISQTPFTGEWGPMPMPQPMLILVTVQNPTVEGLTDLLDVVRQAASADGVFVNQFGVMYMVADCRPVRQEARLNAVADARVEAEDQAAAMNVTVGDVVASRDVMPTMMGPYQPNSCNTTIGTKPYDAMYMGASFDPRLPAEVTVTIAVEVSFDIP